MRGAAIDIHKTETIPEDPQLLRKLVSELLIELKEAKGENEKLRHMLSQLRRHVFGKRSEKLADDQMVFDFEGIEVVQDKAPEEGGRTGEAKQKKGKGHGRRIIPADLPEKPQEHDIPEEEKSCKECGKELERIGEEVSKQLDYNPASFYVIKHIRKKYACKQKDCVGQGVVTAAKPMQPIEKGLPGPGLLAQVVVSKYQDHMPLNRQEQIFERSGIEISRSTLCDWVKGSANLLKPIYEIMKEEVVKSKKLHTDDTTVPVLDEERNQTRKGRLWVYVGDEEHPYTVYEYSPNREKKWPQEFLRNFEGYLQADAYAGYDGTYNTGKVKEVGCWAHARRKFDGAKDTDAERSIVALTYIKELYKIEGLAKEFSDQERKELREEKSKPILEAFQKWLQEQKKAVLPKSVIRDAINYALGQWEALMRYLEDGNLNIDNNAAERALRSVVVGRKNYLFNGSDNGGRWGAILYSLIESCKRNNVNPYRYLRDVISRISEYQSSKISNLTPKNWKPPLPDSS